MNTIDKILMIDSIRDEIAELLDCIDNAKSKALKDQLQKDLDTKRTVLNGFKCSLADDVVASTLYSSDEDDEDDLCEGCCPFDDTEDDTEEGDVVLLRKVATLISQAADQLEKNGKVKVFIY